MVERYENVELDRSMELEAPERVRDERGSVRTLGVSSAVGLLVGGAALVGAAIGNTEVDIEPEVKHATTEATMVKWENMADILAAEGTFELQSAANYAVNVNVELPGDGVPGIGWVTGKLSDAASWMLPDYETSLASDCAGEMQVIVPTAEIKQETTGEKLSLEVDMSTVEINSYYDQCSADQDNDSQRAYYQALAVFRDGLVKVTPLDQKTVPKPDVVMEDIDDNASNSLNNRALESMAKTCGPKLEKQAAKSVEQAVEEVVVNLTDLSADNVDVTTINGDKIDWHSKDKDLTKLTMPYTQMEPTVKNFKFDKQSCDTAEMEVVGEGAK